MVYFFGFLFKLVVQKNVLEPVQDLVEWRITALKLDSNAHILQYAVLSRPLLPWASIDQGLEQLL